MKVLFINEVCGHTSTGKICAEMAQILESNGYEVKIAYGRDSFVPSEYLKYAVRIGNDWDVRIAALRTRFFDDHGLASKRATKKFLSWASQYKPDMVWLHNLHGYYINIEMLFNWIKAQNNLQVKWTLHDCWAFTGHCSHFTYVHCEKWKKQCEHCPQKDQYPASLFVDNSCGNYARKKAAFTGVKNMAIITPSQWLADKVKQSFLAEYPTIVQYNTINKDVFKPTKSDFREKYGLQNNIVILGVANVWNKRKGLDDFFKLSSMLDDRYVIVLVGMSRKQIEKISRCDVGLQLTHEEKWFETSKGICSKKADLAGGIAVSQNVEELYRAINGMQPPREGRCRIILLEKTSSTNKLAALYTMADYFINPTYEDTFPTVNLEAQACGTRVITYDTGGSKETIKNKVTI